MPEKVSEIAERAERLVAELKAARTAWHESYGVPVSAEYAGFLQAIGDLTDFVESVERAIAESRGQEEPLQKLTDAIEWAEENHPLPRCKHGTALKDGAGELLEPRCGCRFGEVIGCDHCGISSKLSETRYGRCPNCGERHTDES